jgi:hypothetical protein
MAASTKYAMQSKGAKNSRRPISPLPHDEKEFRISPRRPPPAAELRVSTPPALGRIYAYARQTVRRVSRAKRSLSYRQRCAVRVTYVGNKAQGQWKAHARYLSRESATHRTAQRQAGFDGAQEKLDVAHQLDEWQKAGDTRLWKIILSPVSVAAKKGTSLAGRKGPPVWLRNGLRRHHSGPGFWFWLPCGNLRCPTATAPFFDAAAGLLMIFEVHV